MAWRRAVVGGAIATLVAMALTFWSRNSFQVRTLPERMMEWLLLFVPIDAFAKGIQTLGPEAKVLALYGSIAVMSAILWGVGTLALRRRWGPWRILGVALILYLVAMAGVMPLTGGGWFGLALRQHPVLINGVFAGTALAYATVLLLVRLLPVLWQRRSGTSDQLVGATAAREAMPYGRRALVASALGTGAAFLAAWRQAMIGSGLASSSLPLASLPPQRLLEAAPAAPAAAPGTGAAAVATVVVHPGLNDRLPTVVPEPSAVVPPEAPLVPPQEAPVGSSGLPLPGGAPVGGAPPPALARELSRDKDGVLAASQRAPGELAPLVTSNEAHYVVTKNAVADPVLNADGWRLVLDGEVNRPVQLDYQTLRQLPTVELYKTLECISNFTAMCNLTYFGCDLISTAQWTGARLGDVLELAGGLKAGVVSLKVQGADEYVASVPASVVSDPNALLVYAMNGKPLPREHGYPVRMLTPGRYGYKSTKWLVGITALPTDFLDWYGQRNWSRTGIVKTMSRIDTPATGARLTPGRQTIAGIAYAGDRGISDVQFTPDGGRTWLPTSLLEPPLGKDTWVRWTAEFLLAPGQTISLQCRAIDGNGQVQSDDFQLPQPNGGSGRHTIEVSAAV